MKTVKDYGARGDGLSDDTRAWQAALDAAGVIVAPPGTYSCGTLFLRGHTVLRLEAGAELQGRPDTSLFPALPAVRDSRLGRKPWRAFLYAQDVEHVTLEGPGAIRPGGAAAVFQDGIGDSPARPFGLHIVRCRHVAVRDLSLEGSAFWMQRYFCCADLTLSGLHVYNHCNLNNDGMDIDGCIRVRVSDCHIDASDDALVLKSESDQACEDIVVKNCVVRSHASAIKFGTGSVGGFRQIEMSGCTIGPSRAPEVHHPFKVRGGLAGVDIGCVDRGELENVFIHDMTMEGVQTPLFIRLGDRGAPAWRSETAAAGGRMHGIRVHHVRAVGAGPIASSITGYPGHPVQQVELCDVSIECSRSAFLGNVEGLPVARWFSPLIHGSADPQDRAKIMSLEVPEQVGEYPVNRMFGCPLPAYGLYARHVQGLRLRDIRLRMTADDDRPAVVLDDVQDLVTGNLDAPARGPHAIVQR